MEIAIIGFGISGIACCRWALEYGFKPTVFEKNSSIGGSWYTKSYPNVQLQTNKNSYSFSDIPMKESVSLYPTVNEVLNYLDEYVQYHELSKYVKLSTEVLSIEMVNNKWEISYIQDNNRKKTIYHYLVLCTGFYTDPIFSNPSLSNVLSVSDFSPNGKYFKNPESVLKDKNIIIIGNGPSGCDLCNLAVENNAKNVKLFYRKPRWIFSRYFFGISLHFLTNRLFLKIANTLPFCIVRIVLIILFMIPLYYYHYQCDIEFPNGPVNRNNLTLNDKFYLYKNLKKFEYIKEPVLNINEKYVKSSKRLYDYDIVIDARGYKNEIKLLELNSIPMLYKHIIYPGFNTLGLVGYAASFNWIMISDLQSRWLMEYFLGKIDIGSLEDQREYIGKEIIARSDFHDLAYHSYDYCDILANDLKINPKKSYINVPNYNEWNDK